MDNGSKRASGQTLLHTDSFSLSDVQLLQSALLANFGLRTRLIEKRPGQFVIAIPIRQITSLKSIVIPYLHSSMLYKV
jgi:hypothetical protein